MPREYVCLAGSKTLEDYKFHMKGRSPLECSPILCMRGAPHDWKDINKTCYNRRVKK